MKISFSTLGCPGWTWPEIVTMAKDFGYNGIELRGIKNELYVPRTKPFSKENIPETRKKLAEMNLEIPCITSASRLSDGSNIDGAIKEGIEYIDLAQALNAPYIRVLGDPEPAPSPGIDVGLVKENLKVLADYAKDKNVTVLIESNGVFARSKTIADLLEDLDHTNLGILWDIHHPFRFLNEKVEDTYDTIKDYIRFIHIKDSINESGKIRYKMMGHGDIPVKKALLLLGRDGYKGFVSLEWVKRWNMELEDPGIVFSQFINYIKSIT